MRQCFGKLGEKRRKIITVDGLPKPPKQRASIVQILLPFGDQLHYDEVFDRSYRNHSAGDRLNYAAQNRIALDRQHTENDVEPNSGAGFERQHSRSFDECERLCG